MLVGLINKSKLEKKTAALPTNFLAWTLLGLLVSNGIIAAVSCVPLKARLQPVRRLDIVMMGSFGLACCAGLTLGVTHGYFVLSTNPKETQAVLAELAAQMDRNIGVELCTLYHVLDSMTESRTLTRVLKQAPADGTQPTGSPFVETDLLQKPRDPSGDDGLDDAAMIAYSHPFFDYVFWSDIDGRQIVKWSIQQEVTPPTPLSSYPWFEDVKSGRLPRLHAQTREQARLLGGDTARPVLVEPLYSPNTGEYLTVLARPYNFANRLIANRPGPKYEQGIALMVAPLASVTAPVLPPGYGFAIVDPGGRVLFNSNAARNQRENFLRECGYDASVAGALKGSGGFMTAKYEGREVAMHAMPLQSLEGAGLTIVTYRDLQNPQDRDLHTFLLAMKLTIPYLFLIVLLSFVLSFALRRASAMALFPEALAKHI